MTTLIGQDISKGAGVGLSKSSARDARIDIARGVGMIMVVWGHALYGIMNANYETQFHRFELISIYTTHMALFFILAGLLAGSIRKRSWPEFWKMALTRVVWPYVLWSVVLMSTHFIMSSFVNTPMEAYRLHSILWKPPSVMWFLYALLIGMILFKLTKRFSLPVTLAIAATIFVAAYTLPNLHPQIDWVRSSLRFIAIYLVAALVGRAEFERLLAPKWVLLAAAVMVVTLVYAYYDAVDPLPGYAAFKPGYIPALLAGPVVVMWLSYRIGEMNWSAPIASALSLVGRRTMPIFVTHILLTAGTRIVMLRMGYEDGSLIVLFATIIGTVVPLGAAWAADRLRISPYLGWR